MSASKLFVKSGDTVMVMSGEDKGKTGKVQKAFPAKGKIVVEGVAMVKKPPFPPAKSCSYARSARSLRASPISSSTAKRHARFALAKSAALRLTTEKEDMRSD